MLFIVATPIGNLGDFSLRAQDTLKAVDMILCEDTRTSKVLLDRYQIQKPLRAYHKFNEAKENQKIVDALIAGTTMALISDAGMPGFSDPGETLIQLCIEQGVKIEVIPGPSAMLVALLLSGFPLTPFQFVGFLSKKPSEYKKSLEAALAYPGTTILYESPHRLKKLLELLPDTRKISISRELTKKFEETLRGTVKELRAHFELHDPKGEFVVIIGAGSETLPPPLTLEEEAQQLQGLSKKESLRQLSQKFRLSKKEVEKRLANLVQDSKGDFV